MESVRSHTLARGLLANIDPEVSIFWEDDSTGLMCKARLDGMPKQGRVLVDLKTTSQGLSDDQIDRSIANYRYDMQAGAAGGLEKAPGLV